MTIDTERRIAINFKVIECASCNIPFAVSEEYERRLRESHDPFYCPRGHCISFGGESETERLKRHLVISQRKVQQAKDDATFHETRRRAVEKSLVATRVVVTRTQNRLKHGLCPCCNRTFVELQKHMRSQHPEYGAERPDSETE